MSLLFGGLGGRRAPPPCWVFFCPSYFDGDGPVDLGGDKVLDTTELPLPIPFDVVRYFPPPPDLPRAAPPELLPAISLTDTPPVASRVVGRMETRSGDSCAGTSAGTSSVFLPLFLEAEGGASVVLTSSACVVKPILLEHEFELLSSLIFIY